MDRKLIAVLLLLVASCGCRTCDNSCDCLPPVLDGPYTSHGLHTGSTFTSNSDVSSSVIPSPLDAETITPTQE